MGRPKIRNPIAEHLLKILKTRKITKEQIAVVCDLPYYTLATVFTRPKVSDRIRTKLLSKELITKETIEEYKVWAANKGLDLR